MNSVKILHLFDEYLPPTQNWAYRLIKNTPEIEVHIAAHHYLKKNFYDSDFTFLEHPFGDLWEYRKSFKPNSLSKFLKKASIIMVQAILGDERSIIKKHIKHHQIDILHAHFAHTGWRYHTVAKEMNIPLVISFYGWDYERIPYQKPAFKQHYQVMFKEANLFICEGENGKRILEGMGCPSEKIKVGRLGVTVETIPFFERRKEENRLNLIQIASFREKKGHIYTVKAFERALKSCPKMHLTLIGDTSEYEVKNEVLDFIKAKRLEEQIHIKDWLDFSQLHSFLKDFDVFIHPSCYAKNKDCEGGAPVVLLDAQATGMPVIATNHCDIPEVVLNEKTGLLSDEKDIAALSEAIQFFYSLKEKDYLKYALNARQHVLNNYDIAKNAQTLRNYYAQILNASV